MAETMAELHNRMVPLLLSDIVQPTLEAGGDMRSVLVLLESVACGVLLATLKLGVSAHMAGRVTTQPADSALKHPYAAEGDFLVDLFVCRVRKRMAELLDAERGGRSGPDAANSEGTARPGPAAAALH